MFRAEQAFPNRQRALDGGARAVVVAVRRLDAAERHQRRRRALIVWPARRLANLHQAFGQRDRAGRRGCAAARAALRSAVRAHPPWPARRGRASSRPPPAQAFAAASASTSLPASSSVRTCPASTLLPDRPLRLRRACARGRRDRDERHAATATAPGKQKFHVHDAAAIVQVGCPRRPRTATHAPRVSR